MKNYILIFVITIVILFQPIPVVGEEIVAYDDNEHYISSKMVNPYREWIYRGIDWYAPNRLGIDRPDNSLVAYHYMKFNSTPVIWDGKEYYRLVLTNTQRFSNFEYDPNGQPFVNDEDYSVKHLVEDEIRNKIMGYFREEDRKVYRLMNGRFIVDDADINHNISYYTEDVIYDWTLSDGDIWRSNPMYWDEVGNVVGEFDDVDLYLEKHDSVIIDGSECNVFSLMNRWNTFIEGIGPIKDGWVGAVYPFQITGTWFGNYDKPELQSYLHGVFNGNGDLIYGEELPQSSNTPRLYLVGDMNDWKIMTEWEIKLSDDPQYGENMYIFTCSENQMISANQKFRIINSDKLYSFGMPDAGTATLQLDTESELANSREAEPLQLDSDWNGSLLFRHVGGILACFTNEKLSVNATHDDKPTSTETIYYDLQGTRIAQPTSGNLYIRISNGNAEKIIFI